ncbi:MAG: hypothetical protein IPL33_13290 [Sphingobacteriales bacterium]|nr:hypothetical protein [Sphingobacteriales bacterium]
MTCQTLCYLLVDYPAFGHYCTLALLSQPSKPVFIPTPTAYTNKLQSVSEEGNYPLAQHDFALYKQQCRNGTTTTLAADCEAAAYYNALCAVKMKMPDAEMLLAQFIDEHESSAWAGRAYYELGKIYFAKKAYKDAIYCYEKADAQADMSAAERGEYYFQLAYSYFVSKDFGRAKDALPK